ncbi:hypothetical protein BJX99DRAFT_232294 [Aspergillus californicus]
MPSRKYRPHRPPTTPSPTFHNSEPIIWDALPCDDIDSLFACLTQPPNPNAQLDPCATMPNQTEIQIHNCDRQYIDLSSGLVHQPVHQPLPPAAPRPNRSFPNYYINNCSIACVVRRVPSIRYSFSVPFEIAGFIIILIRFPGYQFRNYQ